MDQGGGRGLERVNLSASPAKLGPIDLRRDQNGTSKQGGGGNQNQNSGQDDTLAQGARTNNYQNQHDPDKLANGNKGGSGGDQGYALEFGGNDSDTVVQGGGQADGRFRNILNQQYQKKLKNGNSGQGHAGASESAVSYKSHNNSSQSFGSEIGRDRHLSSIRVDYVQ